MLAVFVASLAERGGPLGELANATAKMMAAETGTARVGTPQFDQDNKIYYSRQTLYGLMREDLGVDEPQAQADSHLAGQQAIAEATPGPHRPSGSQRR